MKPLISFLIISLNTLTLKAADDVSLNYSNSDKVVERAILLKKVIDQNNVQDIKMLQQAIQRVLQRSHRKSINQQERDQALKKMDHDMKALQKLSKLNLSPKTSNIDFLSISLKMSQTLIERTPSNLLSNSLALEAVRSQSSAITKTKLALAYLLNEISEEAIGNIKSLNVNYPAKSKSLKESEILKDLVLYDRGSSTLFIPNAGFVNKTDEADNRDPRKGSSSLYFAAFCSTGIKTRQVAASDPIKAGDIIILNGTEGMVAIEDSNSHLEAFVIHSTRSEDGSKEGLIAEKVTLSQNDSIYKLRSSSSSAL